MDKKNDLSVLFFVMISSIFAKNSMYLSIHTYELPIYVSTTPIEAATSVIEAAITTIEETTSVVEAFNDRVRVFNDRNRAFNERLLIILKGSLSSDYRILCLIEYRLEIFYSKQPIEF